MNQTEYFTAFIPNTRSNITAQVIWLEEDDETIFTHGVDVIGWKITYTNEGKSLGADPVFADDIAEDSPNWFLIDTDQQRWYRPGETEWRSFQDAVDEITRDLIIVRRRVKKLTPLPHPPPAAHD